MATPSTHIGTLRERPLHRSLKEWYRRPGDRVELPVGGYVIDLVRDDLLIEIQTSGFSSMRDKVVALLGDGHRIRIVHPIPVEKWIVKVSEDGEVLDRRKSPKRGQATDVFAELVSFPRLVATEEFEIEVVLTREEEFRHHTPGRSWRRKGWSIKERHLIEVVEQVLVRDEHSLRTMLPSALPEPFTTANLAESAGQRRRAAQQMAYCMREAGVIAAVGKRGNAIEYTVVST